MNLLRSGILGGGGGGGGVHICRGLWGSHVQGDSRGGVFTYMFKGLGFTCSGGAGGSHVQGVGVHMFWGAGLGFTCSGGAGGSHVQGVGVHMFWGAGGSHVQGVGVHMFWGGWGFTCSGGLGVRRWSIQVHVFM